MKNIMVNWRRIDGNPSLVSYLVPMSGSDDHTPIDNSVALKRIADRVAFYKKPKYKWTKNHAVRRGALSHLGGEAVGRIFHVESDMGTSPRWRWDLTFDTMSADVRKFHHIGWAASALEAALRVETIYSQLADEDEAGDA